MNNRILFNRTLQELSHEPACIKMRRFRQHKGNNTYQHCYNVARYSFYLAERAGWNIDEKALARGAMLHDYYLYNIKEQNISDYRHGVSHPQVALDNARLEYDLTQKEENIIRSHMWPLTLFHAPSSKEAVLVSMADKICALREMFGETKDIKPREGSRWVRRLAAYQARKAFRKVASFAGS